MATITRLGPDVDYSIYHWLRTVQYTVDAVTATLAVHHAPLAIIPAYPDDLLKVTRSTLALSVPAPAIQGGQQFMGGDSEDMLSGAIYGFVIASAEERLARFAQSRLLNDLHQLLDKTGDEEGIPLAGAAAPHTVYGDIELINVRSRLLPTNAPAVPADRYKFVVEFEVTA